MKGNESRIAFISFHFLFRIGTFQRVTAEKNEIFSATAFDTQGLSIAVEGASPSGLSWQPVAGGGFVITRYHRPALLH
jgi:hypothetical protein